MLGSVKTQFFCLPFTFFYRHQYDQSLQFHIANIFWGFCCLNGSTFPNLLIGVEKFKQRIVMFVWFSFHVSFSVLVSTLSAFSFFRVSQFRLLAEPLGQVLFVLKENSSPGILFWASIIFCHSSYFDIASCQRVKNQILLPSFNFFSLINSLKFSRF